MKVYVTKYALTVGIQEKHVEQTRILTMVKAIGRSIGQPIEIYHKPYWYENYQDAVKHAKEMQTKKIASLQKQMEKINAIKF